MCSAFIPRDFGLDAPDFKGFGDFKIFGQNPVFFQGTMASYAHVSFGSSMSFSTWETCSGFTLHYGRLDALDDKAFGDKKFFGKIPVSDPVAVGGDGRAVTAFCYDSFTYPYISRAQAMMQLLGNFSGASDYVSQDLTMCQLGASAENGFRLSYDSVWPLHVYSGSVVPYGLYDDSLLIPFTFNAQSESFGESQQAEYFIRLVVPYYDDSYRRIADVVRRQSVISTSFTRMKFSRRGGLKREPSCSGGLGLFTFLFAFSVSFGYTLFFLSIRGVVGAVYAGIAGMRMLSSLGTSSRFCLLLLISYCVHNADAVTCYTCYDQCPGCAGGDQCPFITRTTANRAILSGAVLAGGAATSVSLLHLLPLRFLRILTRSVLDSLRTVARRPAAGTPVDLTAMNHQELVTAVQTGASSVESGLREVLDRIGAATTSAEVSKLSALQSTMTNVNKHFYPAAPCGTSKISSVQQQK